MAPLKFDWDQGNERKSIEKESDMKKNSKIFYVPTIPKHVRTSDFDIELSIDDFDALIEISGVKGKVTKEDVDRLLKSKIRN